MEHLKVAGEDHLYRDLNTGAIINTDSSTFEKYRRSKMKFYQLEQEMGHMRNELAEIKSLIKTLAEK